MIVQLMNLIGESSGFHFLPTGILSGGKFPIKDGSYDYLQGTSTIERFLDVSGSTITNHLNGRSGQLLVNGTQLRKDAHYQLSKGDQIEIRIRSVTLKFKVTHLPDTVTEIDLEELLREQEKLAQS